MFNRRTIVKLVVCSSMLMTAGFALAKNSHHNNGHNLLGPKLHQMENTKLEKSLTTRLSQR